MGFKISQDFKLRVRDFSLVMDPSIRVVTRHMIQRCNLYKPKTDCHSHVTNNFIYSEIGPQPVHLSSSLARGIGYSNSKGRDERPFTHHKLSRCSI